MSFFAYVVQSTIKSYLYKGHCANLELRLKEHNSGMTKSLRPYLPVKLVYFEAFLTLKDAILRERFFKTAAGRRYLQKRLGKQSS
ncbi:MAG TPA: GIY-YIG nuclease family protein [Bacteroidia bacterium]|nr:GIY-YIG nuclease family protein [Bacteroidia bacterium]